MADVLKFERRVLQEDASAPDPRSIEAVREWYDNEIAGPFTTTAERVEKDLAYLLADRSHVEQMGHKLEHAFRHLFTITVHTLDRDAAKVQRSRMSEDSLEAVCQIAKDSNLSKWLLHPTFYAALRVEHTVRFNAAIARMITR